MNWDQHFGKNSKIHKIWGSPGAEALLWLTAALCTGRWLLYPPSPGKAIGALAVVAGFISVKDTKVLGKILWICVLAGLLRVEFRAIDEDRADNQKQALRDRQTQLDNFANVRDIENKKAAQVLDSENSHFRETANNLKDAYKHRRRRTGQRTGGRGEWPRVPRRQ